MIGFCSGIGTGLFIGTGASYANAGPAGLLLAFLVVGSVLWCVMQSVAELATLVRIITSPICMLCSLLSRYLPLVRSLTLRAVLSTQLSVSPWPSVTDTATL